MTSPLAQIIRPISVALARAGVAITFLLLASLAAQESRPTSAPAFDGRTGIVPLKFEARHPLGAMKEQMRRFGWSAKEVKDNDPRLGEYDVRAATFDAWIPAAPESRKKESK